MATLNTLSVRDKAHWLVHLNALKKQFPNDVILTNMIKGSVALPNIQHPCYIHDWWEHPEMRKELEA